MQTAHRDISAHSAICPALQEALVRDVAGLVFQIALLNTAILSLDVILTTPYQHHYPTDGVR